MIFPCLNPYCAKPTEAERVGFCSSRCSNDERLRRFRSGTNATCVDCGGGALGGGVWCLDCLNSEDRNAPHKVAARRLSVWNGVAA